jgi:signal transduction histidine kinase
MRGLVLTLYTGVFLVLLGLGWGIDQYYQTVIDEQPEQIHTGFRAVLSMAAHQVSQLEQDAGTIRSYLNTLPVKLILEPLADVPLPAELIEFRDSGNIIMLESDASVGLYLRPRHTQWMLNLEIAKVQPKESNQTRYTLTLLFYGGVAIALLVWLLPLLRGIQHLHSAATKIGKGQLDTRVDNPNGVYLRPLKRAFNTMAERLQRLNENNRLMSQAISHELRTPLSRMRFGLDMLVTRENQQQRLQDVESMEGDLDEMEKLINELLVFARLDSEPQMEKQPIEIEQLIHQRVVLRKDMNCDIEYGPALAGETISVDPAYFTMVIDNLLQNACRYAAKKVRVECYWTDVGLQLSVEDDGPGVQPDQYEQVFKPFYRAKNQDKRDGGFGLGLAIVQQIVSWHHGVVTVDKSKQLGGARFMISLPRLSSR